MNLTTPATRRHAWMDALFADHAALRIFWTNFSVVEPDVLYRSNHPTPANLRRFTKKYGIKTLINLRGLAGNGADLLSREAAGKLGLDFIDLAMKSNAPPQRGRILRLAEVYQTMQKPALVHCKSGADRAGLAAALFLLMEGKSAAQAQAQLALRFGHLKHAKTGILDQFIQNWARTGEGRKPFLQWVAEDYDEAALQAAFKSNPISRFINDRILVRE